MDNKHGNISHVEVEIKKRKVCEVTTKNRKAKTDEKHEYLE